MSEKYYSKDYAFVILSKWRLILICGIIGLVFLSGYTLFRNITLWDQMKDDYRSAMEEYYDAYDTYLDEQVNHQFAIVECERKLETLDPEEDEYWEYSDEKDRLNQELSALAEPVPPTQPTIQSAARQIILRGLFGLLIGAVAAIQLVYLFILCPGKTVNSATEVSDITDRPVLAVRYRWNGKERWLDRVLMRSDGALCGESEPDFWKRVRTTVDTNQRIGFLLLSDCGMAQMNQALFVRNQDGLFSLDTFAEQMDGWDGIVIIVQCSRDRAETVYSAQSLCECSGLSVLGTIVL